jgi:hypothetical protein
MLQSSKADISTFESLQANQHAKTGVSQMAVFNDVNAIKTLYKEELEARKLFEQARDKRDNARDAFEKEWKVKYDKAKTEYISSLVKEADALLSKHQDIKRQRIAEYHKEDARIKKLYQNLNRYKDKSSPQAVTAQKAADDAREALNNWSQ